MFKYGIKYKTDKLTHHGYERFYDKYLVPLRYTKMNFLEIGVDKERSINMWVDFFTEAKIYGIDIGFKAIFDRGMIFKADQSNLNEIKKIVNEIKLCQVIIDDGSHVPEHQLLCFNYLFKDCLEYGGVYIIEDIETSYWRKSMLYGYAVDAGYNAPNNIVKIFKEIVDIVNREFLTDKIKLHLKKHSLIDYDNLKYISSIEFGGNCIIIKKMTHEEYTKYGYRKYRFFDKL